MIKDLLRMLILFTSLHVFQCLSRLEMYLLARLHLFFQQIMNCKTEHFQPHRVGEVVYGNSLY